MASVDRLAVKTGTKGYSLILAPSPEEKLRYPYLSYLWRVCQAALPYDAMHLVLSNVTKRLWELFSGEFAVMGSKPEPYIMSKEAVTTIGREIANGRATVPLTQARDLRDIKLH